MERQKAEMTFDNYQKFLKKLQGYGYEFLTHHDYMEIPMPERIEMERKVVLLRHDVDLDKELRATERLAKIETGLGIQSTVFLRLHDPMYNVFGYREMSIINDVAASHEIGLHCETADVARATGMNENDVLKRDLLALQSAVGHPVWGIAAHGDISGIDNHKFIDDLSLDDYGLEYHAYQKDDGGPFSGWYISNSHGNNWNRYIDGALKRSPREVDADFMTYADTLNRAGVSKCTFLIHPRPWHDVHYLSR